MKQYQRMLILLGVPLVLVLAIACSTRVPRHEKPPLAQAAPAPARHQGPPARAFRITSSDQLVKGPMAAGRTGDYRLENQHVAVIVSDLDHAHGFMLSGGNVIDFVRRDSNVDGLAEVFTWFARTFPRQAIYERIRVEEESASGTARIVVEGRDSDNPDLQVVTGYILPPDSPSLLLRSTITNKGTQTIKGFDLGDAVEWGGTLHFAPGTGVSMKGWIKRLPWVAGYGRGVSYGYASMEGDFDVLSGSAWSDFSIKAVDLPPGASASFERRLYVGSGDIASVANQVLEQGDRRSGVAAGAIRDSNGAPIAGAIARIIDGKGKPVSFQQTGEDGAFALRLAPGRYALRCEAPGRAAGHDVPVEITGPDPIRLSCVMGGAGALEYAVRNSDGTPLPVKLTVEGRDGTPSPDFGLAFSADGAANVALSPGGAGTLPLSPGKYSVYFSHGPEFSIARRDVDIPEGEPVRLEIALERELDTAGWLSGDFHQHTSNSPDSGTTIRDRLIANAAENVEIAVSSDHNFNTDFAPAALELGLTSTLITIPSNELTTAKYGHFGAYPLTPDCSKPACGSPKELANLWQPVDIFRWVRGLGGDKVIQVNHPRSGGNGYFDLLGYNPGTASSTMAGWSADFDAIELFNGKRMDQIEKIMDDWQAMLLRGVRVTALGNSDTHSIVGDETGYPRSWLHLGVDAPAQAATEMIIRAIKHERRVIVSNAPLLELWVNGVPIGGMVKASGEKVRIRARIQCNKAFPLKELRLWVNGKIAERKTIRNDGGAVRYDGHIELPVSSDSFIVADVIGKGSIFPLVSAKANYPPYAAANPVWVDADGDGVWTPPVK